MTLVIRILVIAALILAILAFFGVHSGDITAIRELALGLGLLAVAALL
jgi:hypothetical protein